MSRPVFGGSPTSDLRPVARHEASLSPTRRAVSALAGLATISILTGAVWQLGQGTSDVEAAVDTSTTPVPSTTRRTTTTRPSTTAAPTTSSSAPTTTIPPTTDTTMSTTTTLPPLVLEPDGLGAVDFGATSEEVISAVTERLGPASSDSGWVNARGNFGTCPGTIVRVTRWHSLRLYFGDGPTQFAEEGPHFFYYVQSSVDTETIIDLTTAAGIGIGSSVAQLKEAYPDELVIESTVRFGATFHLAGSDPGLLAGLLTESVDTGQVTAISGGFGCGG